MSGFNKGYLFYSSMHSDDMPLEVVEYICVYDTVQNVMVDTSFPSDLREHFRINANDGNNPTHVMDAIHRLISSKNGGMFDLPHASDVAHSYCPCYPLTLYSGHVPWDGTPYVVHFIGIDEVDTCDRKDNPLYTSIYVVMTRSSTPPARMIKALLSELRPTHIRLSELILKLDSHSGGHGRPILQGWLQKHVDFNPAYDGDIMTNKKGVFIASTVVVIIAIIYMVRVLLRF